MTPVVAASSRRLALSRWLVVTLLLAPGFVADSWNAAPSATFARFQRDTEAHVVGRWVRSRAGGLFSDGALTGVGLDAPPRPGRRPWPAPKVVAAQYSTYLEGGTFPFYSAYRSQPGAQALLLGLLERVVPGSPAERLRLLRALTAMATAATLALVVLWLWREAGAAAALGAGVAIALSEWLTLFASNLWWSTWAFYLPMVATALWLGRTGVAPERRLRCGGVVFATVALKGCFNGFEYATTTLVMTAVPFVYYAVAEDVPWREIGRAARGFAVASVAAVTLVLGLLEVQMRSLEGSWRAGFAHVADVFLQRTLGDEEEAGGGARAHPLPSRRAVLAEQMRTTFADLRRVPGLRALLGESELGRVSHGEAAVVALVATGLLGLGHAHRRTRALAVATGFAILAPLSWLIVFHAHSARHAHINPVTWEMPFTLLGFAVVGRLAADVARRAVGRFRAVVGD